MRDYGVTYKSVPLMCVNSSAICLAQNQVEKGDIMMKYLDTERQLTDIFSKPFDASRLATLRGRTWCFPSLWLGLRGACGLPCIYSIFFIALHFIIST
jgi:hypothetical protein